MEKFYIHFDVENHYITADEFIQAVNSIQITCNDLKNNLLDTKDKCELIILPPENGSFLAVMGIIATTTGTAFVAFCETDLGKSFIKDLTGNEPSYYAEEAGRFIGDSLKGLYTKSKTELKKIIPNTINLDASIKAKSDFYQKCASSNDIKAIGFDNSEQFPIKRKDFCRYMSSDIVRELPSDYVLQELIIKKPETINCKAKWTFKDCTTKKSFDAAIEDEHFKEGFLRGKYPIKENLSPDRIIAKVEYQKELKNGKENPKNINIVDVYSFNDKHLKTIPKDLVLNKSTSCSDDNGQMNIFKGLANEPGRI